MQATERKLNARHNIQILTIEDGGYFGVDAVQYDHYMMQPSYAATKEEAVVIKDVNAFSGNLNILLSQIWGVLHIFLLMDICSSMIFLINKPAVRAVMGP